MELIQNGIRVKATGEIILSLSTWDCKKIDLPSGHEIMVDGGMSYIRRGGDYTPDEVEELTLTPTSTVEEQREKLCWGTRGKDGTEPLTFRLIRDLDASHLTALVAYGVKNPIAIYHLKAIHYWENVKNSPSETVVDNGA